MKPFICLFLSALVLAPLVAAESENAAAEKELILLRAKRRAEQLAAQDKLANEGRERAAEEKKRAEEARAAALRAAQQERHDREGTLTPEKKAAAGLVIDKSGVRKVETSSEYVYFAWQARYTNATAKPLTILPEVRLLDKKGYILETASEGSTMIMPGASRVISGKSMIKRILWAEYATAEFRSR